MCLYFFLDSAHDRVKEEGFSVKGVLFVCLFAYGRCVEEEEEGALKESFQFFLLLLCLHVRTFLTNDVGKGPFANTKRVSE